MEQIHKHNFFPDRSHIHTYTLVGGGETIFYIHQSLKKQLSLKHKFWILTPSLEVQRVHTYVMYMMYIYVCNLIEP